MAKLDNLPRKVTIGSMVQEMGFETVDELLARYLALQDSHRGGPPSG